MKKKVVIIISIVVAVAAASLFGAYKFGLLGSFGGSSASDPDSEIYVTKLSDYMGIGSSYSPNVFMGIVEGQETTGITKSSDREIDQLYVAVGDTVDEGEKLFSYKTDSVNEEITQYGFDIEGYNLTIADYNRQISSLENTLNKTEGADNRVDLENQIAGIRTQIAITQNNIDQTNAKIEEAKKKIANSTVTATSSGQIIKIQDDTNGDVSSDGYYITMLASKELRVKGSINEQNVYSINIDEPVVVRSRIDKSQTWTGTITKIETDTTNNGSNENNGGFYGNGSDSANSSTSYPFYITLDSSDGLMMGQHLYIELGEPVETMDFSNGTYIYDYLLAYDENGNAFAWTMGKGSKLTKTYITLGEYNEENMVYEVTDGISYDDYLAYPMDDLEEGMRCMSSFEGE